MTISYIYSDSILYSYPCSNNNNQLGPIVVGVIFQHEESNNTLVTVDSIGEGEEALLCLTDWKDCCVNGSDIHGSWFLPNGSKVSATNKAQFYVTWGIQTVGLNRAESSNLMLPTGAGIYYCEMMDKNNVTHYLYAGIYPENGGKY